MFENLKENICKDLMNCSLENLDEYIYELHEILPNHIVNVPEQNDYEFYRFAAKFMQYLIDKNSRILSELDENVCKVFTICYNEICSVTNTLSSQSGEDITDDVIKILFCFADASYNTLLSSEDLESTLDLIFTYINNDWANMVGVTLDWDQVCEEVLPSEDNIFEDDEDDENLDWDGFGLEACFTMDCVEGSKSAEHFLELVYKDNGWIGHPEDNIEAGTNFSNYGVLNQDEADWFNANMNAVFDYYPGDPCEYALRCIAPDQFDDNESWFNDEEIHDETENDDIWLYNAESNLLEEYDYEITEEEITEWFEQNRPEYSVGDFNTLKDYLEAEGWSIIEN